MKKYTLRFMSGMYQTFKQDVDFVFTESTDAGYFEALTNERVSANTFVLSAASTYFQAMFSGGEHVHSGNITLSA